MNEDSTSIERLCVTSILEAYHLAIQRIQFLCFSGGDMKEVEHEIITVTDFESAVKAAHSSDDIETLIAQRIAS